MQQTGTTKRETSSAAPPIAEAAAPRSADEDSGLHDIRNLAQSTKQRLSKRIPTVPPISDDVLASSSASWKNLALPQPAKMVSLPAIEDLPSKQEIAARDREVGFAGREQRDAFHRALGRNRRQPDRTAVAREVLRQRLDQFLVFAAGRSDRDPQRDRTQRVVEGACGEAEQENAGREDQQRIVLALPPRAGCGRNLVGL